MRRLLLLAAVGLCVPLVLPTPAQASLPTTTIGQAEWLGDWYAAGLDHYYSRYGLTPEAIQTTRGDFVFRLRGVLDDPLDRQQLSAVSAWLFRSSASVRALDIVPPPLELRDNAANLSHIIALYLSRPPLTHWQQAEVAGQLGVVLDVLREAMDKELAEIPGAHETTRTAIYALAASFGRLITDPLVPLIKRPYTPEEIEELCAYARQLPAGEAARILDSASMRDPEAPDFEQRSAESARWAIHGITWCLRSKVMLLQYTPPQVLSAEEQQALSDYYMNTEGALADDPEAMNERAEEVPW